MAHEQHLQDDLDLFAQQETHGTPIAEITTRIVQVIEVPRSLLAEFLAMEQRLPQVLPSS